MDISDDDIIENNEISVKILTLENRSWEEMRLAHREIEIKVNEHEVDSMEDFDEKDRENKVNTKLEEEYGKI